MQSNTYTYPKPNTDFDVNTNTYTYSNPELRAQIQQPINADGTSVFSVRRGVVPVKFT